MKIFSILLFLLSPGFLSSSQPNDSQSKQLLKSTKDDVADETTESSGLPSLEAIRINQNEFDAQHDPIVSSFIRSYSEPIIISNRNPMQVNPMEPNKIQTNEPTQPISINENPPLPDLIDINPLKTDLNHVLDGMSYMDREFHQVPMMYPKPTIHPPTFKASDLAKRIHEGTNKFIAILGEEGSGRTVLLNKILSELRTSDSSQWNIFIDIKDPAPLEVQSSNDWPKVFLEYAVSEPQRELLRKMIVDNPDRINICVDNIDKLTVNQRAQLLGHLDDLNSKGTGIVVSSTQEYGLLPSDRPNELCIEIPHLKPSEIEDFFTERWAARFDSVQKEQLKEYAKPVVHEMSYVEIPQNFKTINELQKILISGNREIFDSKFISLSRYLENNLINPENLPKMLETTRVNKMKLFEVLTEKFIPSEEAFEYYGLRALRGMFSVLPKDSLSRSEVDRALESSSYRSTEEGFGLIKYDGFRKGEFLNSEHEYYFAAKYIIDQLKSGNSRVLESAKTILSKRSFVLTAEYINSVIRSEGPKYFDVLFDAIASDPKELRFTLDNSIKNGFDEVASNLLPKLKDWMAIADYFGYNLDPKRTSVIKDNLIASESEYKFGMLADSKRTACTKQEMLLRKNMKKTITVIAEIQERPDAKVPDIWYKQDIPRLLDIFLESQRNPAFEIYEYLINNKIHSLSSEQLNELLFKVINNAGINGETIINDLRRRGANLKAINANGETILHCAVQKRDPALLKFITEDLGVPIRDIPGAKSLLATALDSNPLNPFSPPRFWEIMEYMVGHGDFSVPVERPIKEIRPSLNDLTSDAYRVLIPSDMPSAKKALANLKSSPQLLDQLSPEMRMYRRNLVLSESPSRFAALLHEKKALTPVLLRYRGLDTLSYFEKKSYERTIYSAFQRDARDKVLNTQQVLNIAKAFADNCGTQSDLQFAYTFIESDFVKRTLKRSLRKAMKHYFIHELKTDKPTAESGTYSLERAITLQRSSLRTRSLFEPKALSNDRPKLSLVNSCFGSNTRARRRRRSASKCLISEAEYDSLVKTKLENGKIQQILDTDEFMKILNNEDRENLPKEQQLLELGARLVEDATVHLEGDHVDIFKEKVKPLMYTDFPDASNIDPELVREDSVAVATNIENHSVKPFSVLTDIHEPLRKNEMGSWKVYQPPEIRKTPAVLHLSDMFNHNEPIGNPVAHPVNEFNKISNSPNEFRLLPLQNTLWEPNTPFYKPNPIVERPFIPNPIQTRISIPEIPMIPKPSFRFLCNGRCG